MDNYESPEIESLSTTNGPQTMGVPLVVDMFFVVAWVAVSVYSTTITKPTKPCNSGGCVYAATYV